MLAFLLLHGRRSSLVTCHNDVFRNVTGGAGSCVLRLHQPPRTFLSGVKHRFRQLTLQFVAFNDSARRPAGTGSGVPTTLVLMQSGH